MSDSLNRGSANSSGPMLTITTWAEAQRCSRCGTPTLLTYSRARVGARLCGQCYSALAPDSMGLPTMDSRE